MVMLRARRSYKWSKGGVRVCSESSLDCCTCIFGRVLQMVGARPSYKPKQQIYMLSIRPPSWLSKLVPSRSRPWARAP